MLMHNCCFKGRSESDKRINRHFASAMNSCYLCLPAQFAFCCHSLDAQSFCVCVCVQRREKYVSMRVGMHVYCVCLHLNKLWCSTGLKKLNRLNKSTCTSICTYIFMYILTKLES